jgi:hypothetical protein
MSRRLDKIDRQGTADVAFKSIFLTLLLKPICSGPSFIVFTCLQTSNSDSQRGSVLRRSAVPSSKALGGASAP